MGEGSSRMPRRWHRAETPVLEGAERQELGQEGWEVVVVLAGRQGASLCGGKHICSLAYHSS